MIGSSVERAHDRGARPHDPNGPAHSTTVISPVSTCPRTNASYFCTASDTTDRLRRRRPPADDSKLDLTAVSVI